MYLSIVFLRIYAGVYQLTSSSSTASDITGIFERHQRNRHKKAEWARKQIKRAKRSKYSDLPQDRWVNLKVCRYWIDVIPYVPIQKGSVEFTTLLVFSDGVAWVFFPLVTARCWSEWSLAVLCPSINYFACVFLKPGNIFLQILGLISTVLASIRGISVLHQRWPAEYSRNAILLNAFADLAMVMSLVRTCVHCSGDDL